MIASLIAVVIAAFPGPLAPGIQAKDVAAQTADAKAELQHQQDLKSDVEVGAKYAAEVDKQTKPCTDPDLIKRVQRIGAEMADIANQTHSIASWGDKRFNTFNYSFKVIQDDEPNAFSLPGGYVYIQTGLLKFIQSDDELAGVLAHEISHAKFRHLATLQRDASKISAIQLPLIIAAILTQSPGAAAGVEASTLAAQALGSGWSVQAEQAADYGGIQLMVKSKYNPTGMLTVMERLALEEKGQPQFYQNLGIFRTHPPSKERADSMMKYLKEYNIPVERSKVTTSFRAMVKPNDKTPGAVDISFAGRNLLTFCGNDALTRADQAAANLNTFIDTTPAMYQVAAGSDGIITGKAKKLLQFQPEDVTGDAKSVTDLQKDAVANIQGAIYTVAIRIWETH